MTAGPAKRPVTAAVPSPPDARARRRGGRTRRPRRPVSIYGSLLTNLALVIVLLSAAIMALTFVGSQHTVRTLSDTILRQSIAQVNLRLQQFFDPAIQGIALVRAWDEAGLLHVDDPVGLDRLLTPLLRSHPNLSAIILADEQGREHFLIHLDGRWRSRQTRRDAWGDRQAWREWAEGQSALAPSWQTSDYDPRQRPWYRGAIRLHTPATEAARPLPRPKIYWTEPYTFFTARAPGLTAAAAYRVNGRTRVVGFDVLLTDISEFTRSLRPATHGAVMVLTDDDRIIGLPGNLPRDARANTLAGLLERPSALGDPVAEAAVRTLREQPGSESSAPVRLVTEGAPWWAARSPFRLGPERTLSIVVMVRESDLLGSVNHFRLGIVLVMLTGLALAIVGAVRLARRYSRPIEMLVRESDRISRGDLDAGPPVSSSIAEVRRLADAHDGMRRSLRTLLKLERDLQLARRIQQDTLPEQLPALRGFEVEAWNEPADETGGDIYDVIGCRRVAGTAAPHLSLTHADRAVLLLADAVGHGIGPALAVTEVRAMLRMAIRAGESLPTIIRHLNAQLCADLSEGRFVTMWLAELDVEAGTIAGFSCGQGPLLHFRAAARTCDVVETDAVPLGLLGDMDVRMRAPVRLEPGDVFVALSDGIVDAGNAQGEPFGTKRVIDLIAERHATSSADLLAALRDALDAFTEGRPADDDRTVIIVKRTVSR